MVTHIHKLAARLGKTDFQCLAIIINVLRINKILAESIPFYIVRDLMQSFELTIHDTIDFNRILIHIII